MSIYVHDKNNKRLNYLCSSSDHPMRGLYGEWSTSPRLLGTRTTIVSNHKGSVILISYSSRNWVRFYSYSGQLVQLYSPRTSNWWHFIWRKTIPELVSF